MQKARTKQSDFISTTRKNLSLLECASDLFGVKPDQDWRTVVCRYDDRNVELFYRRLYEDWFSVSPDSLLPAPDNVVRLSYVADKPSTAQKIRELTSVGLCADQVVILDPFSTELNYLGIAPPSAWGYDLFHRLSFLMSIRPLIHEGVVCFLPDPHSPPQLPADDSRNNSLNSKNNSSKVKKTSKRRAPDYDEIRQFIEQVEELFKQDPSLAQKHSEIVSAIQEYKELESAAAQQFIEERYGPAPYYDNEAKDSGIETESGLRITMFAGNIDINTLRLVSETSKAIPYALGRKFFLDSKVASKSIPQDILATSLASVSLPCLMHVTPQKIIRLREKGYLSGLRCELRDILNEAANGGVIDLDRARIDFQDRLQSKVNVARAEWASIDRDLVSWAGSAGFASAGAMIFSPSNILAGSLAFILAASTTLIVSQMKRREFMLKNPLAPLVMLDIASKTGGQVAQI